MQNIHVFMSYIFVLLYSIYCVLSSPDLPEHIQIGGGQGLTAVEKSGELAATASGGGVQGQFVGEVYNECQKTT